MLVANRSLIAIRAFCSAAALCALNPTAAPVLSQSYIAPSGIAFAHIGRFARRPSMDIAAESTEARSASPFDRSASHVLANAYSVQLPVQAPPKNHRGRNVLIGAVLGAGVVGIAYYYSCTHTTECTSIITAVPLMALGAGAGAVVGLLVTPVTARQTTGLGRGSSVNLLDFAEGRSAFHVGDQGRALHNAVNPPY